MKWVTRAGMHIDRTACAWLIKRRIDPQAEFAFVPAGTDAKDVEGHSFDMRGAEYTHVDGKCSFEALLEAHGLVSDEALAEMGKIVRGADVPSRGRRPRESGGMDAIMRGFQLSVLDDHEKLSVTAPVYDALYAYCRELVADKPSSQATPRPRLRYSQRVMRHLGEPPES